MIPRLLIFILISILPMTGFGQNDKEEIKKTFEKYFKTVEEKDNAKTLDYIYPKLFNSFPREKMLQAMERMKADTSTVIAIENGSITNISDILEVDGIKYALIKYSFKMRMSILITEEKIESDTEEDTIQLADVEDDSQADDEPELSQADFTYEMLKEKYGEKNIAYDRENSRFSIDANNAMYSIYDPIYKSWKFLEKKEGMKPVLNKLLPKRVLNKL